MRSKTVASVICAACLLFWPVGDHHANDEVSEKATGYEVTWWNIGYGAVSSSGGSYEVTASVGQPVVGEAAGGVYFLTVGYMSLAFTPGDIEIFVDGFESGDTSEWGSAVGL